MFTSYCTEGANSLFMKEDCCLGENQDDKKREVDIDAFYTLLM